MNVFHERLKQLRLESGLSQQELANQLKISRSTLSNYEHGNREPNFEMLELITNYFNVDMNYLTGYDNDNSTLLKYFSHQPELLETCKRINDNDHLKLLFDNTKDLTQQDLEPVLILIDGIRKHKGLK